MRRPVCVCLCGSAAKKEEVVVKDLMLNVNIDEPGKPLSYRLLAWAGQGNGRISGQGSLVIPSEGIVATDRIRSDCKKNYL